MPKINKKNQCNLKKEKKMPILLKFVLENARGNRYYFTIDKGLCILIRSFTVAVKPVK